MHKLRAARDQRDQWSIGSNGALLGPLALACGYIMQPKSLVVARAIEHQRLTHRTLNGIEALSAFVPLIHDIVHGKSTLKEATKEGLASVHRAKIKGDALQVR